MSTNSLFNYRVEETDGKLVISVEGLYAQAAIQHLKAEAESGLGWRTLARLSPIGPLNRLARQAARAKNAEVAAEAAPLDLNTIFRQGFAENYAGFTGQLDRYASTLATLRAELDAAASPPAPAVAEATVVPAASEQPAPAAPKSAPRK